MSIIGICLFMLALESLALYSGSRKRAFTPVEVVLGLALMPLMMTTFLLLAPQQSLRITHRGVQRLWTGPFRSRFMLRWEDIERLRWRDRGVALCGRGKTLFFGPRSRKQLGEWNEARDTLRKYLEGRFDLQGPIEGPTSNRSAHLTAMGVLVAAHLAVLGSFRILSPRVGLSLLSALISLTFAVKFWFARRARKADWRYPRESGERRW